MPCVNIIRNVEVVNTPRVQQLTGMFDVPPSKRLSHKWSVVLPLDEKDWNIGLIVGPSGCGKTTIINELFKNDIYESFEWDDKKSILDCFPEDMGIKKISAILNSVGFSSPPSWLKPFHVLSNGEKFRVFMARALSESKDICVIDEFTSVVDRTVAKIGSHAVAKTVRRDNKKFIAVSCHYDIEEWLQPDWIYKPHENEFQWRLLRRRPEITLDIYKVHRSAWGYFKEHHYLSSDINSAAQCFVAFWDNIPVSFYSYIHFQNNKLDHTKRGHRSVCLPDYQGCGIGIKLEEYIASCLKALNYDFISAGSHPARFAYMSKSKNWQIIRKPSISRDHFSETKATHKGHDKSVKFSGRMLSTFRYKGESEEKSNAEMLINQKQNIYNSFSEMLKEL